ncbi:MAG: thiE, partial [Dehalococcoidia bacterium]|nr:thiE [Dehalococcoidia bacterium]
SLTSRLRDLRHTIASQVPASSQLYLDLMKFRSVEGDVGAEAYGIERNGYLDMVAANARRAQESLRVLEEVSKLPQISNLDSTLFQEVRFEVYRIEQDLTSRLARLDRMKRVVGLYAIVDPEAPGGRSVLELAEASIKGGAKVIQLRDKRGDKGLVLEEATALKKICELGNALLIINDHPDVALASDADGVHLGQKDLPIAVARRILPVDRIVGISTATVEEAQEAARQGADYIAVGSMFPTSSKEETRPAGPSTLAQVRAILSLPLVAIGGINLNNLAEVVEAGADAVAVISVLSQAEDVEATARQLVEGINQLYEQSKG